MSNFLDGVKVDPAPYLEHDKAMLQDLYDGYGWDNLAMDMDEVHDRVDGFGIEHEVSRSQL